MQKCIYQPNPDLGTWFHANYVNISDSFSRIYPVNKTRKEVVLSVLSYRFIAITNVTERPLVSIGDWVYIVDVAHLDGLDSDCRLGDILKVTALSTQGVALQGEEGVFPYEAIQKVLSCSE